MFDFNTLFVVTMFISAVAGLLMLLAWRQNPTILALGLWGSAFLMSAVSMMLLIQGGTTPNLAGQSLGTMLWITAYGVMWTAARSFEGRHTPLLATLAGALLFLVVCQFDSFANSLSARMMFSSAAVGVYLLMSASEIWRGNDRELVSRWPAIVVLVVHGGMFLGRVPLIDTLPYPAGALPADTAWFPAGVFELLFFTFCMPLLLVNMAKERAELQQRQHSLLDPLTGVANRRDFFERGAKLLRRSAAEGHGSALLLFDLDRFKNINDTYGHQAGDRVLLEFCETVQPMLRPNDLFGRFSGEEFGCLIAEGSVGEALAVAERIRAAVAAIPLSLDRDQGSVTVSVGVAMSNEAGPGLPPLFAAADRALYRAKAKGRNRVEAERKPLQLVPSADAIAG